MKGKLEWSTFLSFYQKLNRRQSCGKRAVTATWMELFIFWLRSCNEELEIFHFCEARVMQRLVNSGKRDIAVSCHMAKKRLKVYFYTSTSLDRFISQHRNTTCRENILLCISFTSVCTRGLTEVLCMIMFTVASFNLPANAGTSGIVRKHTRTNTAANVLCPTYMWITCTVWACVSVSI